MKSGLISRSFMTDFATTACGRNNITADARLENLVILFLLHCRLQRVIWHDFKRSGVIRDVQAWASGCADIGGFLRLGVSCSTSFSPDQY